MGAVIIVLFIIFVISRNSNKKQKRRRTSYFGKSDWESTCDDGGKFFNW